MAVSNNIAEPPPPSCLVNGIDPLLLRLQVVFGDNGRPDIAREIVIAERKMARLVESAAERVPVG
jgi:hypothetical protein